MWVFSPHPGTLPEDNLYSGVPVQYRSNVSTGLGCWHTSWLRAIHAASRFTVTIPTHDALRSDAQCHRLTGILQVQASMISDSRSTCLHFCSQ